MPETIPFIQAAFLVCFLLGVSWASIFIGFAMGRKGGPPRESTPKTYFSKKDLGEEEPGDIYTDMLEEPKPEGKRIDTIGEER